MNLQEAISKVAQLDPYRPDRIHLGQQITSPSGRVTIDYMIQRGLKPCPICGESTSMGLISVKHRDGRTVAFDPALFHYVKVGHPIKVSDIAGDMLIAIMSDS